MTIYATGNAVGSTSPKDLIDNTQNFDLLSVGPLLAYPDRRGVSRLSQSGMESAFTSAQIQRDLDFQSQMDNMGYELPAIPYAGGVTISRVTQLLEKDGEYYRAKPGVVPFVTTGSWPTDLTKLVYIGDASLRFMLAQPAGAALVGLISPLPDAVATDVAAWVSRFLPTLEDFGGKGDYATDNKAALAKLLASGAKGMRLNQGIYRFSDAIELPTGFLVTGVGAPTLGFGTIDDKQWLRPGFKHLMPGSSMIFSGTGTKTFAAPQRIDEFATMRPMMRLYQGGNGSVGTKWTGFAVIQDMDCFTGVDVSVATKPGFENKADYEVGILLDDVSRTECTDVVQFGYMPKAGCAISSVFGNDDPDYNTFRGGSLMGKHGLAELGSNNGPATYGLSGTRLFGTGLYTLDHHSRGSMTTAELIAYYAPADAWDCWYIDGDVNASSAEINGHYAYGCEIRTRANHPLRIDHASNLQIHGGVCEVSPYGITNSDVPTFIGSANVKRGVGFYGFRMNYTSLVFNDQFVGLIPVPVMVSGDPLNGRMGVFGKNPDGGYTGSVLGSDGNVGDAAIQLTKDANNGSADWKMNIDISDPLAPLQFKYGGVIKAQLGTLGSYGVNAPAGSDAAYLLTSNGGASVWALRTQFSSTGQLQFRPGGTSGSPVMQILTSGTLTPGASGASDLGTASLRYSNAYLVNAPNVSSDENLKDMISDIPDSWLAAVRNVNVIRYKMKAAMALKGDANARWHIGVIAQQIVRAFADQGVDAFEIGIVGKDSWGDMYDDVVVPALDSDGTPTGEYIPTGEKLLVRAAGEELSVRYEELLALKIAALERA
jgi:hypothetical protein